ncbi:MAG TPA: aminopeptidase, partial [Chitinophagaceae bacterium]
MTFLFVGFAAALRAQTTKPLPVESGVSHELAVYRKSVIGAVQYSLDFQIPEQKAEKISGAETIDFDLKSAAQNLQLDFKATAQAVKRIAVNNAPIDVNLQNEHLIVDKKYLRAGRNKIAVSFFAGDASLNRNDDYLYALFVPDHARTVFPCFDQPDLKARFLLTLQVPTGWKVLANAAKKDSLVKGEQTVYCFANSDPLSTYLFSFTAGKYNDVVKQAANRRAEFLHRETDSAKIRWSVDSVFSIHANAIRFLEDYTGIAFPFQKLGFAAIPDFQFGGMEHPGEVQYKASSLFLDET